MNNKQFVAKLRKLGACGQAVDWVIQHGGTSAECWHDCIRGDWMAWLAAESKSVTKRQLVGALADCAALSLKYYEAEYPKDKRVRDCIETCKRYSKGNATKKELDAAANAAAAAFAAANAANAAYAAYAANAAYAAANAAAYAAYAANAAYAAANAAAYAAYAAAYAAYAKTMKQCAVILRQHFPDGVK